MMKLIEFLENYKGKYILSADVMRDSVVGEMTEREFPHVHGISLNKEVYNLPYYWRNKYSYNNKYDTHYPDGMFEVVYDLSKDISNVFKFFQESTRILADNGVLIVSFKLPYPKTFNLTEIYHSDEFTAYKIRKKEGKLPKRINILLETKGIAEGIRYTTDIMKARFNKIGIKTDVYKTIEECPKEYPTIVEWMPYMKLPNRKVIVEAHDLPTINNIGFSFARIFSDVRYWIYAPVYFVKFLQFSLRNHESKVKLINQTMVTRSYELAEKARIKEYYIMPHCLPPMIKSKANVNGEICLGAYGFAAWYKNFDETCKVAKRLKVKLIMLLSVNYNNDLAVNETLGNATKLQKKYGDDLIQIKIGEWSNEEIAEGLKDCTHIISTQFNVDNVSSSMRFAYSLGKPIISIDNYQAREAQVIRVKNSREITKKLLEKTRNTKISMDDGFRYVLKILGNNNA